MHDVLLAALTYGRPRGICVPRAALTTDTDGHESTYDDPFEHCSLDDMRTTVLDPQEKWSSIGKFMEIVKLSKPNEKGSSIAVYNGTAQAKKGFGYTAAHVINTVRFTMIALAQAYDSYACGRSVKYVIGL